MTDPIGSMEELGEGMRFAPPLTPLRVPLAPLSGIGLFESHPYGSTTN